MDDAPKKDVQDFYDRVGWRRTRDGRYVDTASFVDTRAALQGYHESVARRPDRWLPDSGDWFLDAGCGALPAAGYLETARRHRKVVCLDFSAVALRESRQKLGGTALYVQADVSHLPFCTQVFSSVYSAHVLYHLPDDDHRRTILEFVRVLRPKGRCAIVYTNPECLMNRLAIRFSPRIVMPKIPGARWLWRRFLRRRYITEEEAGPSAAAEVVSSLFFNPKPLAWVRQEVSGCARLTVRCWASAGLPFTTQFIPDSRFGAFLLCVLRGLEGLFPKVLGRLGAYPLLDIRRRINN